MGPCGLNLLSQKDVSGRWVRGLVPRLLTHQVVSRSPTAIAPGAMALELGADFPPALRHRVAQGILFFFCFVGADDAAVCDSPHRRARWTRGMASTMSCLTRNRDIGPAHTTAA